MNEAGPQGGAVGSYGPNDHGYMVSAVRTAAQRIHDATYLYSEGHYPHSNARIMPADHPLAVALSELAKFDREFCKYANLAHDPKLFTPHMPTEEAMHRWDHDPCQTS